MSTWQPISSMPFNVDCLTFAEWSSGRLIGISRRISLVRIVEEVEHESTNRKGRRYTVQEREESVDDWEGDHYAPTHWMPLPAAPKGAD